MATCLALKRGGSELYWRSDWFDGVVGCVWSLSHSAHHAGSGWSEGLGSLGRVRGSQLNHTWLGSKGNQRAA